MKIISDEITNTIVILSTPEDYAAIVKAIEQIDIVPRQVVIEGMIASVSLTDNLSLGLARLFKGSYSGYNIGVGLNLVDLNIDPATLSRPDSPLRLPMPPGPSEASSPPWRRSRRPSCWRLPISSSRTTGRQRSRSDSRFPSSPRKPIGAVGVTPQRNYPIPGHRHHPEGQAPGERGRPCSLELYQEVSTSRRSPFAGTEQIILNKTEATTSLVVQDNQTIVIGGLIREDTPKQIPEGIPFLSKIPIIGWLFGNTDDDERQELIILLTPHVIKNQKEAKNHSSEYVDKMSESSQGRIKKEEIIREKTAADAGGRHAAGTV